MLYQNILQKWSFKYIGIFMNIKQKLKIWKKVQHTFPFGKYTAWNFSTLKFILSSIHAVKVIIKLFLICHRPFKLFSILAENSIKFWIASLRTHHTNWTLQNIKGYFLREQTILYVTIITWHWPGSWGHRILEQVCCHTMLWQLK